MESGSAKKGVGGARKKECLADSNFTEIKSLIEYVNCVLMPRIGELEKKVTVLTKTMEITGVPVGAKRPRFNLEIEDEGSDNSDDEEPFY